MAQLNETINLQNLPLRNISTLITWERFQNNHHKDVQQTHKKITHEQNNINKEIENMSST
jgi:hypothetical protein